jgi:hypothetical protein
MSKYFSFLPVTVCRYQSPEKLAKPSLSHWSW